MHPGGAQQRRSPSQDPAVDCNAGLTVSFEKLSYHLKHLDAMAAAVLNSLPALAAEYRRTIARCDSLLTSRSRQVQQLMQAVSYSVAPDEAGLALPPWHCLILTLRSCLRVR